MHKVFITYHHANDWWCKDELLRINERYTIFIDKSVHAGDMSPDLPDQTIRGTIRDEYLRDSTVTILLVGTETWGRKHVDWEVYSSMIDGTVNKRSGILVVNLPSTGDTGLCTVSHAGEKQAVYPELLLGLRALHPRRLRATLSVHADADHRQLGGVPGLRLSRPLGQG